jgi:aspartyl aminopeptidase
MQSPATDLVSFINSSPTAFHATRNLAEGFLQKGFTEVLESQTWNLKPGGKYFVRRNGSALVAFVCGLKKPWEAGFRAMGAHTDSPALRVKPKGELLKEVYNSVRVELYGGPIVSTWLDRELGLAGRVFALQNGNVTSKLVNTNRPVAIVPNLAIHMNREVNKGFEYNPHNHLSAIFAASDAPGKAGMLFDLLAEESGLPASAIVDADLFFHDATPARLCGKNNDFIVAPRLDNLAMCHAIMNATQQTEDAHHTTMAFFFDNEETGSCTYQGADSSFAAHIMERIVLSQKGDREEFLRSLALSFLISADMAHALHPNFSEKHDEKYAPVINAGPVIKQNGNNRYATTAETAAIFEGICKDVAVPVQRIINRADVPCGSTIGPMSSAALSIRTVDIGNPMWAMHSARETAGTRDHELMIRALSHFCSNKCSIANS